VALVALMVWSASEPTNRTASSPDSAQTTGIAPKAPPASTPGDPATQSSPR
jgi:hypothetical protein